MNKIAVLTFVYPGVETHLSRFLDSLKGQTLRDFDLIAVNDCCPAFGAFIEKYPELSIKQIDFSGTIAQSRQFAIQAVIERGYEKIVFADADDFFCENRVETSDAFLNANDLFVNDFHLVSEDGQIIAENYLSKRLVNRQSITFDFLKNKNCCGSNIAIRSSAVLKLKLHSELLAVDWFLCSWMVLRGSKAVFSSETCTYYRQHGENFIGINKTGRDYLKKCLDVKAYHYREISLLRPEFGKLAGEYMRVKNLLESSTDISALITRKKVQYPLWWEEVCLLEDENA